MCNTNTAEGLRAQLWFGSEKYAADEGGDAHEAQRQHSCVYNY